MPLAGAMLLSLLCLGCGVEQSNAKESKTTAECSAGKKCLLEVYVECLRDADCAAGMRCDLTGAVPKCVSGGSDG